MFFKIFELLACNKPILYIGDPEGEGARIALKSGLAYVCKNNIEDCIRAIDQARQGTSDKHLDKAYFSQFNQKDTAERYFELIKSIP